MSFGGKIGCILNALTDEWHKHLPFLFEKVADYTELLLPDYLLSADSIPAKVIEALDADTCKHVEVIGWQYQFYVSKQKDKVFEALKKNKKIEKENIPAATSLPSRC